MNNNKKAVGRRERRGVGVIIGGVILAAILLTSVFAFYVTILNNDKAKSSYEIQSQQDNRDKGTETYIVDREQPSAGSVEVHVNNTGSLPMVASKALVYCSSDGCTTPGKPIHEVSLSTVLNPGESLTTNLGNGQVTGTNTYTFTVISERGNIISSTTCSVQADGTCLEDSGGGDGIECVTCAVTEGIIQGTGSLQLDFKAFGALFPGLGSRANVDQRGWDVVTSSGYSSATGYPAFDLPAELNVVLVEKIRNLDSSGDDLIINRNTGLVINVGKATSGQPDPSYVCYADKATKQFHAYDESNPARRVVVPHSEIDTALDEGWEELFFCSTSPNSGTPNWKPDSKFNNINGVILIARGTYEVSNAEYAQTIPYQAIQVGKSAAANNPSVIACLRSSDVSTSCPAPTAVDNATPTLKYSDTSVNMQDSVADPLGLPIWIHVNTITTNPYSVFWVYPDGNYKSLKSGFTVTGAGNNNIPINIPRGDSDDTDGSTTDIGDYCSTHAVANKVHFALAVVDNYDSSSYKNAYYMTWRMDCP